MKAQPDEFARFVSAQNGVCEKVLAELAAGKKSSHWMWFIFPQLRGLGRSEMSRKYGIVSMKAAKRYLDHALLGPRLRDCTQLVLDVKGKEIEAVLNYVDAMKFHSCMTLFFLVAEDGSVFSKAIDRYFMNVQDANTLRLLRERRELP